MNKVVLLCFGGLLSGLIPLTALGGESSVKQDAPAADTIHAYCKANGVDIKGESQEESLGRRDSIEIYRFEQKVITAREAGTGMATGRRQYEPLLIKKRVDKSSPLLLKALVENAKVDCTFKFFRPSPRGDGTTQQFYTIAIRDGRVASVLETQPDLTDPATSALPPMEEVTFVFGTISWTYTDGGITWQDNWSSNR